jgi:citrate synthase
MGDPRWPTAITDIRDGEIRIRGQAIDALARESGFAEVVGLIMSGRSLTAAEARVVDAVLVCSIDHGATSPSALTARTVASTGAPVQTAATAGLLALSKYHGATVSDCAKFLVDVVESAKDGTSLEDSAVQHVTAWLSAGARIPGYGHRVHKSDPRVATLFDIARSNGIDAVYIDAAEVVGRVLGERAARQLPINLDTAIAAVLLPFIPADLVLGVFMISRLCGLFTQAAEEASRMRPMRKVIPDQWHYDGPGAVDA